SEGSAAIRGANGFGFFPDIEDVERLELHAVGGLHGLDTALEKLVGSEGSAVIAVERLKRVQLAALRGGIRPLVAQIGDHLLRFYLEVAEGNPLILSGQETGARQRSASSAARSEHDEGGKVFVLRSQSVGNPRARGRPGRKDTARVEQAARRRV